MREITNKTHCIVAPSLGKFWVTKEQAETVERAITAKKSFVKINGDLIQTKWIAGVVSGENLKDIEREKRGDWKCKYGEWHDRNQQCGHHLVARR